MNLTIKVSRDPSGQIYSNCYKTNKSVSNLLHYTVDKQPCFTLNWCYSYSKLQTQSVETWNIGRHNPSRLYTLMLNLIQFGKWWQHHSFYHSSRFYLNFDWTCLTSMIPDPPIYSKDHMAKCHMYRDCMIHSVIDPPASFQAGLSNTANKGWCDWIMTICQHWKHYRFACWRQLVHGNYMCVCMCVRANVSNIKTSWSFIPAAA